jgi:hypothetical protein
MQFAIYADLLRLLSSEERSAIFEALEANVPGSGCVGLLANSSQTDEMYFVVEALSEVGAMAKATHYASIVLSEAGFNEKHKIFVNKIHS